MNSDVSLLERYAQDRQEGAFAELVKRHLSGVYGAALRRVGGDAHAAEDVAQRVFVALARKASSVSRHPCLTGWLYTATRNEAAKLVRTEQRRKAREALAEPPQEAGSIEWGQLSPVLDQALDGLGSLDRDLILLRVIDHLSYQQLGERFRLSEDAARMRLNRAMDKLRAVLARGGIASTAAILEASLAQNAAAAVPADLAGNVLHDALAVQGAGAATGLGATLLAVLLSPTAAGVIVAGAAIAAASWELRHARGAEREWLRAKADYDAGWAVNRSQQHSSANAAGRAKSTKPPPTSPTTVANGDDPVADGKAFLLRHPEVKAALADFVDADGRTNYRGLFRKLNLSPDQIAQFLAIRHQAFGQFGRELENGTVQLSLSDNPDFKQYDNDLQKLLGPDGYQQYTDYSTHESARTFTANVASLLATSPEPLTVAQANLVSDLYFQSTRTKDPAQKDAILGEAQTALSVYQYGVMTQFREYMSAVGWFHD